MAPQPNTPRLQAAERSRLLGELLGQDEDHLLRQARFHSEFAQDADDALAEACVAFLRRYEGVPALANALHWMLATVRHAAWEISKRRRRRERAHPSVPIEDEAVYALAASGPGPAEFLERAEELARVTEAIGSLPAQEREALLLFGLGYSYAEIAELRGWSRAKVNMLLSGGRARVRQFLRKGSESS